MGIYEAGKDLFALAKAAGNMEFQEKILALQADAMELLEENRTLKARVRELEDRALLSAELEFKNNRYWRGDDGPFCSACHDSRDSLVRLHHSHEDVFVCPSCEKVVTASSW